MSPDTSRIPNGLQTLGSTHLVVRLHVWVTGETAQAQLPPVISTWLTLNDGSCLVQSHTGTGAHQQDCCLSSYATR